MKPFRFLFINIDWQGPVSKRTHKIHFALPPLDLLIMKNLAETAGAEATLIDGFTESLTDISHELERADWIIVTTTPYVMWQCPNIDWALIRKSIARFPAAKTVLTGLHASVFPEQTLRETGVHAVIRREPESVFKEFLSKRSWRVSPSVSYLEEDRYCENGHGTLLPMDDLAVQKYGLDISKYSYFLLGGKTGIFEASRGCPWKCTFCDQEMFGWKYRTKSPEVFAEEVARGIEQTGMDSAYFFDLEFTVSRKRTLEICRELMARGVHKKLRWACQTRADTVDVEILDALKAAGCTLIHYGVESGNPHILASTNKKIDLATIKEGVALTKKKGIQTACFYMFGLPGEKPEEFANTLELAREMNPTYASFHFAIPFPGTELYELYLKERGLPFGVWPETYFHGWSPDRIKAYVGKAFMKFYLQPRRFELQEFRFRLSNLRGKLRYFGSVI